MAISIIITNQKIGKSHIYSELNHQGKREIVPTYRMIIFNESGTVQEFAVTRDTVVTAFGQKSPSKYGKDNECPPNKIKKPYLGHIRTDGEKGFRIELYEPGIGKKGNRNRLKGTGKNIRRYIQIHLGPGKSEGCFLLKDWLKGRDNFKKTIVRLLREDRDNDLKNPEQFIIRVQSR